MRQAFLLLLVSAFAKTDTSAASTGFAERLPTAVDTLPRFSPADVFALEYATDPQIAPSGQTVVYIRNGFNVMTDGTDRRLWELDLATGAHRKLTLHERNESSPAWSPSADRLAYTLATDDGAEVYVRWMATGQTARLATLPNAPRGIKWSPDGRRLAFAMHVDGPEAGGDFGLKMPARPKDAKWADKPRVTTRLKHEADGSGYLPSGHSHLFALPAEGGTARQLTGGDFDYGTDFDWLPDGASIVLSTNRRPDRETEFLDDDLFLLRVADTSLTQLTDNYGPDNGVAVSPDGKSVAYLRYTNEKVDYQMAKVFLLELPRGGAAATGRTAAAGASANAGTASAKTLATPRALAPAFDREFESLTWSADGKSLYGTYTDAGRTKLASIDLGSGRVTELLEDLGGAGSGRPYTNGTYSVADDGQIAYTQARPARPADVALHAGAGRKGPARTLTQLNEDLLPYRELGEVREVKYGSLPMHYGADTTTPIEVQGWVVLPPGYTESRKYPVLVENHGGPILAYGPNFSAEMQLYAAHDYIVFYPNARGSTGYGEAFSQELYRNYPNEDYDDVMRGVDYLIGVGMVHPDSLYVTGGSAGGIMTAWIVGSTDRFRAAMVAKPVVNWISKTLVADNYYRYANARYEGQPYENPMGFWKFSPLSLVGNVTTPTAVMVGMDDLRTPPSEAKQLYHALKLRGVETALVEFPGASHDIARRPSQMIQQVNWTLGWFDKYR